MPKRRALSVCIEPGCPEFSLANQARCQAHHREWARSREDSVRAGQAWRAIYRTPAWRALRRQILQQEPWCRSEGCHEPATVVDHIRPLQEGGPPYDPANLQPMCKRHHDQKTANEVNERRRK